MALRRVESVQNRTPLVILDGDIAEAAKWVGFAFSQIRRYSPAMPTLRGNLRVQNNIRLGVSPNAANVDFNLTKDVKVMVRQLPYRIIIHASKIGVYVTVMDKASPSGAHPNGLLVPFQSRQSRLLFLDSASVSSKPDYYAGGTLMDLSKPVASDILSYQDKPTKVGTPFNKGGFWYSGGQAVSWVDYGSSFAVYVGGQYVSITKSTSRAVHAICLGGIGWLPGRFAPAQYTGVTHTFVVITRPVSLTNSNAYTLSIYGYREDAGTYLVLVSSMAVVTLGLTGTMSGFTEDGRAVATLTTVTTGSGNTSEAIQTVTRLEFTEDYAGVAGTAIHTNSIARVSGTSTLNVTFSGDIFASLESISSLALAAPGKMVFQVKAEGNGFELFRGDVAAFAKNSHQTVVQGVGGDWTWDLVSSTGLEWNWEICRLQPDGSGGYSAIVADVLPNVAGYSETWQETSENPDSPSFFLIRDLDNERRYGRLLYFSAKHKVWLYELSNYQQHMDISDASISVVDKSSDNRVRTIKLMLRIGQQDNVIFTDSQAATIIGDSMAQQFDEGAYNPGSSQSSSSLLPVTQYADMSLPEISYFDAPLGYSGRFLLYCYTEPVSFVGTTPKTLKLDLETGQFSVEAGRLDEPTGSTYTSPIGVTS